MIRPNVYNSPTEAGLRALALLSASHPEHYDLETLIYLDYLLVHSGDVPDAPTSLHPATPARATAVFVRRGLVQEGLTLYAMYGLVEVVHDPDGLGYLATESAAPFLACLRAEYTRSLLARARWVSREYGGARSGELRRLFEMNVDKWGAHFEAESVLAVSGDD